jgi:hypothetical protein
MTCSYTDAILVRVVGYNPPFVAGILIDPATQRSFFAAPILWHLVGQPADKLRQGFMRLGWKATIVKRGSA